MSDWQRPKDWGEPRIPVARPPRFKAVQRSHRHLPLAQPLFTTLYSPDTSRLPAARIRVQPGSSPGDQSDNGNEGATDYAALAPAWPNPALRPPAVARWTEAPRPRVRYHVRPAFVPAGKIPNPNLANRRVPALLPIYGEDGAGYCER